MNCNLEILLAYFTEANIVRDSLASKVLVWDPPPHPLCEITQRIQGGDTSARKAFSGFANSSPLIPWEHNALQTI